MHVIGHKTFSFIFFKFFKCLFIFESERERDRVQAGEGQREGDTESQTGSGLRTVSTEPVVGLELMNLEIMTQDEVRRVD